MKSWKDSQEKDPSLKLKTGKSTLITRPISKIRRINSSKQITLHKTMHNFKLKTQKTAKTTKNKPLRKEFLPSFLKRSLISMQSCKTRCLSAGT